MSADGGPRVEQVGARGGWATRVVPALFGLAVVLGWSAFRNHGFDPEMLVAGGVFVALAVAVGLLGRHREARRAGLERSGR